MANEDMLRDIEYLRKKANVSYEEAATLLEHNDGNVIRVLMVLEQQGRLYQQSQTGQEYPDSQEQWQKDAQEAKDKAKSLMQRAMRNRVVIERTREDGVKETVLNVNAPLAAGAAVVAPWLAVASAAIGVATGCKVKIEKDNENA